MNNSDAAGKKELILDGLNAARAATCGEGKEPLVTERMKDENLTPRSQEH
jgi:hypothetical protein